MKALKITQPFLWAAMLAATVLFAACKDEVVVPTVKNYAKVMLYHGATDVSAISLQIGGVTKTLDSLQYNTATPYYDAELTTEKKNAIGVVYAKTGLLIAADSAALTKGIGYSYFAYRDNDANKTVNVLKAVDNLVPAVAGKARLRLVHLIPDLAINVDVEAAVSGGSASDRNDFTNVKFKDIRDFVDIPKGVYDFKIKISGTKQVLITVVNVNIEEAKIYTLVARGYANAIGSRGAGVAIITNK